VSLLYGMITRALFIVLLGVSACRSRTDVLPPVPALPATVPIALGNVRSLFALRYVDIAAGTGVASETGKCAFVHYTGWLTDGKKFDSSRDTTNDGKPRTPISFPVGSRRVIAGWDLGFEGMRVGAQRRLFIPYQLAYGARGRPPVIPPSAELVFDVELMRVTDTVATPRPPGAPAPTCPAWQP
jgi:peptidylprolyl isomerase